VSEAYEGASVAIGLAWLALIDVHVLSILTHGIAVVVGATIAALRIADILVFSLHWMFVAERPLKGYRRSLAGFVLNLFEVAVYTTIAMVLAGADSSLSARWGLLKANIGRAFRLDGSAFDGASGWIAIFAGFELVVAWFLIIVIIANVVGGVFRGEQRSGI
jgi:hypothetical protein